jgi:hypothetical protein
MSAVGAGHGATQVFLDQRRAMQLLHFAAAQADTSASTRQAGVAPSPLQSSDQDQQSLKVADVTYGHGG